MKIYSINTKDYFLLFLYDIITVSLFQMNHNVTHRMLGLFKDSMSSWFTNQPFNKNIKPLLYPLKPIKNLEIPLLQRYDIDPGPEFWSIFPSSPIPSQISTPINIEGLRTLLQQVIFRDKLLPPPPNQLVKV